jgi:hypothetical protein
MDEPHTLLPMILRLTKGSRFFIIRLNLCATKLGYAGPDRSSNPTHPAPCRYLSRPELQILPSIHRIPESSTLTARFPPPTPIQLLQQHPVWWTKLTAYRKVRLLKYLRKPGLSKRLSDRRIFTSISSELAHVHHSHFYPSSMPSFKVSTPQDP